MSSRTLVWFSCGAASAVAAKIACMTLENVEVLYCDTLAYEHPDNVRFMRDVETWIGRPIKVIGSDKYTDIFDVFRRTGWLIGPSGARCTRELKANVRKRYQQPDDLHVFGLTADERHRIERFERNNDIDCEWILADRGITKAECYEVLRGAGIELPAMYRLGYNNNNCIGCVKGQAGYWNKIRRDFPEAFARMAAIEREMGVAINKRYEGGERIKVFLDELPPDAGRHDEPEMECGVLCLGVGSDLVGIYESAG